MADTLTYDGWPNECVVMQLWTKDWSMLFTLKYIIGLQFDVSTTAVGVIAPDTTDAAQNALDTPK